MQNTITLTEYRSNLRITFLIGDIQHMRPENYDGTTIVTVITLVNNQTKNVLETIDQIERLVALVLIP